LDRVIVHPVEGKNEGPDGAKFPTRKVGGVWRTDRGADPFRLP
jgi:hypothetical protein